MPVWPTDLPPPMRDGYRLEPVDPVIRSAVEAGPPRSRRRHGWTGPRVQARWRLTPAETDRLLDWWASDCQHGALPAVWYEPTRGRPGSWFWARPPSVEAVGPGWRHVSAELLCRQEWWPGSLAASGRSVYVWDARRGDTLAADLAGAVAARVGGPAGRWTDRVGGVPLAAAVDDERGVVEADAVRLQDGAALVNGTLTVSLSNLLLAVACAPLIPQAAGFPRLLSVRGATFDYAATNGFGLSIPGSTRVYLAANSQTRLDYNPGVALGARSLLWSATAGSWRLEVDGVSVSTDGPTGLASVSAGGLGLASRYDPDGARHERGHVRVYGLAIVSGGTPTLAERALLARWAAALVSKDLDG